MLSLLFIPNKRTHPIINAHEANIEKVGFNQPIKNKKIGKDKYRIVDVLTIL